ncbi:MAG: transposase [Candidatus Cyclobacteriaceae bacterium M2_1C_046]
MRKSSMLLNEVYFWTDTIKNWNNLLMDDFYKLIIIQQLQWLIDHKKIIVYGYVIMPNHIHLLWELLEMNGKEKPHASFNKWTSSQFLKNIRNKNHVVLPYYVERTIERNHRFWIRDPLAVLMDSRRKFECTLDYIHCNPLQVKWNLVTKPENYRWSSAAFYEKGSDEFGIVTHYSERYG